MPLAVVIRSGTTPSCSQANQSPVRQKPLWISSAMNRIPCSVHQSAIHLKRIADWCTEHGILFIADEIQSGFCRTGDWFACEHEGVVPDLITTAKGIAGGLPLAAVTGRSGVMDSVHGGGLGGTYGGNPVACAAALGAIETMEAEDLCGRAREIEALFMPA